MREISIGADIGGSHITTMAVDLGYRTILSETCARYPVNSQESAEEILLAWKASLAHTMSKITHGRIAGIGFAMPGPFDYPNGIALFSGVRKFDSLYGLDIRSEIKALPGLPENTPVRFLNDATCFAIGEAWLGEASGFNRVIAITLGTGFGSAFLRQGVPVTSGEEVPLHGWVYHLPCGDSIADDHFSTRWFTKRYHELTGRIAEDVREIALSYLEDPAAKHIFKEFGLNLGQFMAPLINRFNAECLVIGGSISLSFELFKDSFRAGLSAHGADNVYAYVSTMGENAAIAGSARLSEDEFYQSVDFSASSEPG